jgi:hypothetical protein
LFSINISKNSVPLIKQCFYSIGINPERLGGAVSAQTATGVVKEITFAKDYNVPIFGVYVGNANISNNLPDGLQRNRTINFNWDDIASAINQMMKEGKNK